MSAHQAVSSLFVRRTRRTCWLRLLLLQLLLSFLLLQSHSVLSTSYEFEREATTDKNEVIIKEQIQAASAFDSVVDSDLTCILPSSKQDVITHDRHDQDHHNEKVEIVSLGSITPAKIVVLHDFLDIDLVQSVFQNITNFNTEWTTVIPQHQQAYRATIAQHMNSSKFPLKMFRAPTISHSKGGFPGVRTNLTEDYQNALRLKLDSIRSWLLTTFELKIHQPTTTWHRQDSFFGNVCYHPETLSLSQRLPHTDTGFVNGKQIQLALVHYLSPTWRPRNRHDDSKESSLDAPSPIHTGGGTAFFAETASHGASRFRKEDCQRLQQRAVNEFNLQKGTTAYLKMASCHCRSSTTNKHCLDYQWYQKQMRQLIMSVGASKSQYYYQPGSIKNNGTVDAAPYTLLHHVPYRFNTAVLYDAQQLHSAYINDNVIGSDGESFLQCHPTNNGRITANIFLV